MLPSPGLAALTHRRLAEFRRAVLAGQGLAVRNGQPLTVLAGDRPIALISVLPAVLPAAGSATLARHRLAAARSVLVRRRLTVPPGGRPAALAGQGLAALPREPLATLGGRPLSLLTEDGAAR